MKPLVQNLLLLAGLLLVLAAANLRIYEHEKILRDGRTIHLALAPVDPRSLLQGDYMILRYAISRQIRHKRDDPPTHIVVRVNEHQVASYSRLDDGTELALDELRLRVWWTRRRAQFGAESYFFQEGEGARIQNARFGILKVDSEGNGLLAGLANEAGQPIN